MTNAPLPQSENIPVLEPVKHTANPVLPQHDLQKSRRDKALKENRKKYQYNYAYIPSVAMLEGLPPEELPSLTWSLLAGKRLLQILQNQILLREKEDVKQLQTWSSHSLRENLSWLRKKLKSSLDSWLSEDKSTVRQRMNQRYLELRSKQVTWGVDEKPASLDELIARFNEILSEFLFDEPDGRAKSIQEFNDLFQSIEIPEIHKCFQADKVFGYLRVAGPNPTVIEQTPKGWQKDFPVTDSMLQNVPGFETDTLKNAEREHRLYWVNYEILQKIQPGNYPSGKKYISAPKALFAISKDKDKTGQLLPIAIQCNQIPDPHSNPIFTPKEGYAWEIAKTFVQIADGNHHEMVAHLAHTHLLMEAFMVATHRQLAPEHPLNILLLPHFEGMAFINWSAQAFLIADNGVVDQLLAGTIESSRALAVLALKQKFSFNERMLPENLKRRKVDNPVLYFPYREDANCLWNAIHSWVKSYLELYYLSDSEIKNDHELQQWAQDIVAEQGGRIQGFGEDGKGKISTLAYLTDAVTMIIFSCSVQHAAVNFPQYTTMSYTPAVPLAAYAPPPVKKRQIEQDWLDRFPPLEMAHEQLATLYLLGSVYYGRLGGYKRGHFKDSRVAALLDQFQAQLEKIESDIRKRNAARVKANELAYMTLLPSAIPQSINI